ncbi:MAG TPA: hypothetical protein VM165_06030 [Planctomycetaceae bacterium]|nr:hypothetical protein [Planctomycetaceae bacterium]
MPVVRGLQKLEPDSSVTIISDSTYVREALKGRMPDWLARNGREADGSLVRSWDLWKSVGRALTGRLWSVRDAGTELGGLPSNN